MRSSSRIFWRITFFALCVAILPKSFDSTSQFTMSPSSYIESIILALARLICSTSSSTSSTTVFPK